MPKTKKHKLAKPFDLDNVKELENLGNRHIEKQLVNKLQQEVQAEMDLELLKRMYDSVPKNDLTDLLEVYNG